MNDVQLFSNEKLKLSIRAVKNADGSISVNVEDVAKGLGFITVAKSGNAVIRWARVNQYLNEFGFYPKLGKDDFIPESVFYLLAMKATNDTAKNFQLWIAKDVIPQIRQTGSYNVKHVEDPNERLAEIISKCTMPEQLDLIRDLYNIPANIQKKEQNEPLAPTIKVLKNKDCPTLQSRYRTIDGFLKNYTIHEGDLTKDVYHDYCEYCHTLNVTPRTRQAFVARMKETTKFYIEYSSTAQQSLINRRK